MARFLKLDLCDEDQPIVVAVETETIEEALNLAYLEALSDDTLEGCYGTTRKSGLSKDDDSIQWAPGDGGQYTVFVVVPDTPEGREKLSEWTDQLD